MLRKYRWATLGLLALVILASVVVLGLPYGKFGGSAALADYAPPGDGCPQPRGNEKLALIGRSTPLYVTPAGELIVVDNHVLTLVPGATFFMVGVPVTGKDNQLWTQICVGGKNYPWIPMSAISGINTK